MLTLVGGSAAQETPGLQRTIEHLSSPPSAEELTTLGAEEPNAYIYFLQDYLKGTGSYGGSVNGQLTNATIRAIVGFCREAGFAETCVRGPLLPQSIAAVSEAIAGALAPVVSTTGAVTAAAEAPATIQGQPIPAEVLPELPAGWRFSDNGGRDTLGLEVELVSAGPAEAVIHISGTARRKGYFNIEIGPATAATAGTWVTQVSAGRERAEGTGGTIWLRTARFAEKAYLGELFNGIKVDANAAETTITGTGEPSADTTRVLPYVQLTVMEGDRVDTTIRLSNPSLVKGK